MLDQSREENQISSFVCRVEVAQTAGIGASQDPECGQRISDVLLHHTNQDSSAWRVPRFSMCIRVPAGHLNVGTAADTNREEGSTEAMAIDHTLREWGKSTEGECHQNGLTGFENRTKRLSRHPRISAGFHLQIPRTFAPEVRRTEGFQGWGLNVSISVGTSR